MDSAARSNGHAAYLPRMLPPWAEAEPGLAHREVDGTLVLFDISGFTRLTERLSRQGRAGAEELSGVLDAVYGVLVGAAEAEGADLLKWGGDAVLMLFEGRDHPLRAVRAALGMQRVLGRAGRLRTSVGEVVLRASSGVDSGTVHLVLAGDPGRHRELIVLGPVASNVCRLDGSARAGQVVVGEACAALLPPGASGRRAGPGRLVTGVPPQLLADPLPAMVPRADPDVVEVLLPPQLRTHLADRVHEPEHRAVAAAFLRFDGTDELLSERGPAAVAEAVDALVRTVQEAVGTHGASFHESDVDVDGGKIMLVAGAPLSTGDDTDHLLAAVRSALDHPGEIAARAGLARGRVFTGDLGPPSRRTYSVKGNAVNLAARLASRATPGELLAPAEVLARVRHSYRTEPREPQRLKGLRHPVETVAVVGAEERSAAHAVAPLEGRDDELARLTAAVAGLTAGKAGGAVELVGEPGIGKTRLVEEVVTRAGELPSGVVVVTAGGSRSGALAPYGTARQVLAGAAGPPGPDDPADPADRLREHVRRVAPDLVERLSLLGAVLGVELADEGDTVDLLDEQFRVELAQQAVVELLGATLPGPALIVVEDSHLVDPASAGLLDRIVRETAARPWLVLSTRRDGSDGWSSPGERIDLAALDADAARRLVEAATPGRPLPPAVVEVAVRRAGGHPLFLRELAHAAARGADVEEPPESVEELVAVQLDALPGHDRALLRRAAVLGTSFPVALLARLANRTDPGVTDEALREALGALRPFLIEEGPERLSFRHAVHREVAYAGLSFRTRASLHGRVAEMLEEDGTTARERPELLALHYFASGRYEPAWRHARHAGHHANERYAPAAAAEAFARAAEAARRASPVVGVTERGQDLESLGDALFLCGRPEAADEAYHEAYVVARPQRTGGAELMLKRAKVAQRLGRHSLALRRLSIGLSGLEEQDDEAAAYRARLLARRAAVLISQGRYPAAGDAARSALTEATAAGELDARAQAHLVLHTVHIFSGTPDDEHHGEAALRLYEELGDLGGQAHSLNNLALRRLLEGRWTESLEMFGRAAETFRRVGDSADEANASYNQADLLNRQGRYAEALALLEGTLRVARAVGDEELVALVLREQGRALARDGRAEGPDLLAEARTLLVDLGEPHEVTETDIALGEAHLLAGRADVALGTASSAVEAARSIGAATLLPSGLRVRAAALVELGRLAEAGDALSEGRRLSESPDLAHERVFLELVEARLGVLSGAVADGDPGDRIAGELEALGVVRVPLPWPVGGDSAGHG
ncbi:tetratricopeptide repeat protein [Nocardioides guangzhouensis]|uniref:Tetratricopeptide repeat protein n=1 Tax=Nocardioides guangzhouensis TaxID=2497878 RepID=A0A4Q4ZGK5_9ACTN|nr:tetratricopeptide repeat protein [Nocardioides guangzhouensis]RYP87273.1 tetratricopeptide repeat protein [Nocardioides guangzhouensis]